MSHEPLSPESSATTQPGPSSPIFPAQTPHYEDHFYDPSVAHLPELSARDLRSPPRRRWVLPLTLFLATCASTFWVGVTHWEPVRPEYAASWPTVLAAVKSQWPSGLTYMAAIIGILLTHEMGHFLMTVRYGVPASLPIFIPVPFNAIGTMGAVIGMDGLRANRKQIFDIGVAGPLAGLIVAIPVLWFGVNQLDLGRPAAPDDIQFYMPLLAQWMLKATHAAQPWANERWVALGQLNPLFMAGWVGMLITGLNMMPISQLDGGHAIYALFLRGAHTLARMFISLAIFYVVVHLDEAVLWTPMLLLVIFLGIHHPPTSNDAVPLGPVRWAIGLASLAIPVLCFPLLGFR
jgi:hypothetical protein